MNTYEVTFVVDGHRYAETIQAQTHQDARRLIQARYPDAMIWDIQRVG